MRIPSLWGPIPLLAVSLALFAPVAAFAQADAALLSEPSSLQTEVTRFGLRFLIPDGATVTDDTADQTRSYAVSTLNEAGVGSRLGVQALTAAGMAELPAAVGTPEFAGFLSEVGGVPVTQTDLVLQLGDGVLRGYRGTGTRLQDGVELDTRMLFLASHEVAEGGTGYLIGVFSIGLGTDAAALIESDFVLGLGVAPVDAPADASGDAVADAPADAPAAIVATDAAPPAAVVTTPEPEPAPVVAPDVAPAVAADVAIAAALPDPSATMPLGWVPFERFGVRFAAPASAAIDRDRAEFERREFSITGADPELGTEYEFGLRVIAAAAMADLDAQPGDPAFDRLLSRWSEMTVTRSDRILAPGGVALRLYVALRPDGEDGPAGMGLYLIPDAPLPGGDTLMIGGSVTGYAQGDAEAMLGAFVGSLEIPDPVQIGLTSSAVLMEGLVSLSLAEGESLHDLERAADHGSVFILSSGEPVARIVAAVPAHPIESELPRILDTVTGLSDGVIAGLPVWVVSGTSAHNVVDRGGDGGSAARVLIPQGCVNGNAPWLVALGTRPDDAARLDALQSALMLSLPEGAEPCDLVASVRASLAPVVVPDVVMPPVVTAPVVTPPEVTMPAATPEAAEAAAWQWALSIGENGTMLAFLEVWPRGLHSGEARAWLMARGIVPPDQQLPAAQQQVSPPDPDADDWAMAMGADNSEVLWTYLKAHPQGVHVAEARALIEARRPRQPVSPQPVPQPAAPHK